jgi:heptosyltransferase-1
MPASGSLLRAPSPRILVVRLGAMGDILHTLPAAASLKHSFPASHLTWLVEPQWTALLEGNPFVDGVVLLRRQSLAGLFESWRTLRSGGYDFAVDFQGLFKSALAAASARPERIFGFHQSQLREPGAALFYSNKILSRATHVVEKNLDLAAGAGASGLLHTFPLPPGRPEGDLPNGDFVLASPLAGWRSKQWPIEHYQALAARLLRELGVPLVLNLPPQALPTQALPTQALPPQALPTQAVLAGAVDGNAAWPHTSGLPGLIYATRRAAAIVGVDSGPLHLAAAIGKPGVAIYGPTDPARNGPYGGSMKVLRLADAATTYKRGEEVADSMRRVSPDEVFAALKALLAGRRHGVGSPA